MAKPAPLPPISIEFANPADAPWVECIRRFVDNVYQQSRSRASYLQYRMTLQIFFGRDLSRSPADYHRQDVEEFLGMVLDPHKQHLKSETSPRTRNARRSILQLFYDYASDYQFNRDGLSVTLFSGRNPAANIRASKVPRKQRGMTPEEVKRFFAVIPTNTIKGLRDRAIFLTYFWTGKRKNEIAQLRWRDIQPDEFNGRNGWCISFTAKGRAGGVERAELPADAKEAIDIYLRASGRQPHEDDYVFTQLRGIVTYKGRVIFQGIESLGDSQILVLMKEYLLQAKLDTAHCVHSFRHTAAQLRRKKGLSIEEIQSFLGHKSPRTTWEYLLTEQITEDRGAQILASEFGGM